MAILDIPNWFKHSNYSQAIKGLDDESLCQQLYSRYLLHIYDFVYGGEFPQDNDNRAKEAWENIKSGNVVIEFDDNLRDVLIPKPATLSKISDVLKVISTTNATQDTPISSLLLSDKRELRKKGIVSNKTAPLHVSLELEHHTDKEIVDYIKKSLPTWREKFGYQKSSRLRKYNFSQSEFNKIRDYQIVPLMDLWLYSLEQQNLNKIHRDVGYTTRDNYLPKQRISDRDLELALYPPGELPVPSDNVDFVNKTVRPFLDEIIRRFSHNF